MIDTTEAGTTKSNSSMGRILIVEDERIVARDIQATLRRLGYEVPTLASSFDTALEKAALVRPDLVLQDINIEGEHDGIETAIQLREQFDIPVIFLTAYSDDETLDRAKAALPFGFLLKPFEERELLAAIEMAFYKHDSERRLRESEARARRSEAQLATTLRSIGDGVIAVDLNGAITFINPVAEEMTGWQQVENQTLNFDQVFRILDENTRQLLPSPLEYVQQNGKSTLGRQSMLLQARDKTEKPIDFNASPMFDEDKMTGFVVAFRDISERKLLEERLLYQAFHDPLTRLPNRALFSNRLRQALEVAGRTQSQIAVLFIDMDNFKLVNDSMGHAVGDSMLIEVGQRLGRALRASDTASRFGGDEFTILLERAADAVALAERLLQILQEPFHLEGQIVYSSPSIGVAIGNSDQTADELLRHADVAMYNAKKSGRACYAMYENGLSETTLRRLRLGNELRQALENSELELHYQPKIDLRTNQISGVEALARWNHPTRGAVSPTEFVPLAEEIGLAAPLGRWVLRRACEQVCEWDALDTPHLLEMNTDTSPQQPQEENRVVTRMQINVNLSPRQLKYSGLVDDVAQVLRETGLAPERLMLEITEDAVMDSADENLLSVLSALKALGVRLAIDDFGTGYSNLSYLNKFPLDTLKIDRCFVSGIKENSSDATILQSMIELAHALQMSVVAEGAETSEEVVQLRALECDTVQGFYFAHPMPAHEITAFASGHALSFSLPTNSTS